MLYFFAITLPTCRKSVRRLRAEDGHHHLERVRRVTPPTTPLKLVTPSLIAPGRPLDVYFASFLGGLGDRLGSGRPLKRETASASRRAAEGSPSACSSTCHAGSDISSRPDIARDEPLGSPPFCRRASEPARSGSDLADCLESGGARAAERLFTCSRSGVRVHDIPAASCDRPYAVIPSRGPDDPCHHAFRMSRAINNPNRSTSYYDDGLGVDSLRLVHVTRPIRCGLGEGPRPPTNRHAVLRPVPNESSSS